MTQRRNGLDERPSSKSSCFCSKVEYQQREKSFRTKTPGGADQHDAAKEGKEEGRDNRWRLRALEISTNVLGAVAMVSA